jgi:hypothetical protein
MWKTPLYHYNVNNYAFNNSLISITDFSTNPLSGLLYTGLKRYFNMFLGFGAIVFYRPDKALNGRIH